MKLDTQFLGFWTEGFDWGFRATLLFALAGLVSLLLRNRSAAIRHLVWSAALLGALILPFVKWSLPGWNLPARAPDAASPSDPRPWLAIHRDPFAAFLEELEQIAPAGNEPAQEVRSPASEAEIDPRRREATDNTLSAWSPPVVLVLAVWGLGAAGMMVGVLAGAWSLRRVRRSSLPLPPQLDRELGQCVRTLGLRRNVTGRLSTSRSIPMTWGALRPVVLLPAEATEWSRERRQMVLLHELGHVQRWDFVIQLMGQVSRAVHWFNPLAWWALNRLRLEQERACDDVVLNAGTSAADYAAELVTITARLPRFSWDASVALAIRRYARIEQRLLAILDGNRDRRRLGVAWATIWVAAFAVGVSLVAVPRWPGAQAAEQAAAPAPAPKQTPKKESKPTDQPNAAEAQQTVGDPTLIKVRELIRRQAASEIDPQRLTEGAIQGMLDSLQDPHSGLLSREDFREFQIQVQGELVGIGAQLVKDQEAIVISATLPNSPAAKAGLQPRDVIVSAGGVKLSELKRAVESIRGPKGTEVVLKIRRGEKDLDVTITRDVVSIGSVRGIALDAAGQWRHELDADAKISYLQIVEFDQRTVAELESVLARLHSQGLKGLILDLRGCPGGLFDSCVQAASLFINSGTVATFRSRQQPEQKFDVAGGAMYSDLPLVVVVDELTASAAEVFAGALQDNQRAILVGERTFGKGSVQSLIPVDELNTSLKLTTAQMYRASGAALHRAKDSTTWGVDPNEGCFVPLTAEQRTAFRERRAQRDRFGQLKLAPTVTPEQMVSELADPALAAAVQTLSGKLKTGEFTPSGRPLAEMQAQLASRDTLRAERDQLLDKLKHIEKQLGNVR